MQGMEASANVVVLPQIWNTTTLNLFLAVVVAMYLTSSCYAKGATEASLMAILAKYIIVLWGMEVVKVHQQKPRHQDNAQAQRKRGRVVETKQKTRVADAIIIDR